MRFTIYQDSRQGPRRYNQDRVAHSYSKEALLIVLADGLGGHQHGEVAAQLTIETLTTAFQRLARPALPQPFQFLEDHIRQAHDEIDRHALLSELTDFPRTTVVAAVVQHNTLYCAHAGDSRLYHFRGGELLFRTEDHSKVQMLYRKGMIRKEDMLRHPERNKIYNCVGGETPPQIDLAPAQQLQQGDVILLCTDGLWSMLEDEEIAAIVQNGPVTDTVPVLLDLAESRAGTEGDNVSAVAFSWGARASGRFSVSTALMPLGMANTVTHHPPDSAPPDADDDIERVIAEIHVALEKISGR